MKGPWVQKVKMGFPPPYTHQNGTWLANRPELIFSTCVRGATRKMFPFLPGANLGGCSLLRKRGNGTLEIMCQAGGFPTVYPNGAKIAQFG